MLAEERRHAVAPLLQSLVPDFAGDDVTEQLPRLAVELHQLHLFDREEVVGHLSEIHVGVGDVVRIGQVKGGIRRSCRPCRQQAMGSGLRYSA